MKIKRFLMILMIVMGLISSYFLVNDYNQDLYYRYSSLQDEISIIENKKTNLFFLQFKGNKKEVYQTFIEEYSKKYQDTFLFVYSIQDITTEYKHFSLYTNNQLIEEELEKRNCNHIDFSDIKEKKYYSTNNNDQQSIGWLELIDNDIFQRNDKHIIIETAPSLIDYIDNNTEIGFHLFSDDNVQERLSQFLIDTNLNEFISIEDLSDGYSPAQLELITNENTKDYQLLIIFVFLVYVLFFTLMISKKKKEYMIKRIHGISVFSIVKKDFLPSLCIHYILYLFSFYIMGYVFSFKKLFLEKELMIRMGYVSFYMFIAFVILIVFVFFMISYMSHIIVLKKEQFGFKTIMASMILKVFVLLVMTQPLLSVLSVSYDEGINYYYMKKNKEIVDDLYYIDTNFFDNEDLLVNSFLKEDGYYCDFHTYAYNTLDYLKEHFSDVDEDDLKEQAFDYPVLFVNKNYIKAHGYQIKDKDNHILDLDRFDKDKVFVPTRYKNKNIDIVLSNGAQLQGDIEIIEIKDTGVYVNYDSQEPYTLENPVIYLVTQNYWNVNMQNLYLKGNPQEITNKIQSITNDSIPLISMKQRYNSSLITIQEQFKEDFIKVIMYVFVFIGIIYQMAYWFIEEYKKLLMIEYIFGKSRLERYSELFLMSFSVYLIPLIIQLLIFHSSLKNLFGFYLLCILFEFFVILIIIYRLERNHVSTILKGENHL